MGRPLRCIPQPNQFIGYIPPQVTSTTSTTSTIPPEDISKYINLPISGFPCPVGAFTTTSTTSTTLSPMALDGNINQCSLYNVTIVFENQEVEISDCSKLSNIPSYGSAVIRYQPCSGTSFINELINTNSFLCVAGTGNVNNIRAISGKTNISRIGTCDSNVITTTTSTTQTPQITTSTTTSTSTTVPPNKLDSIDVLVDRYGDFCLRLNSYMPGQYNSILPDYINPIYFIFQFATFGGTVPSNDEYESVGWFSLTSVVKSLYEPEFETITCAGLFINVGWVVIRVKTQKYLYDDSDWSYSDPRIFLY